MREKLDTKLLRDREARQVDLDLLAKGNVFPVNDMEQLLGEPFQSKHYQRRLVRFAKQLEARLRRAGKPWTVSCTAGEVVVHEDPSASTYNRRQFGLSMARARQAHRRLLGVDVTHLGHSEVPDHDRAIVIQVAMILGARTARDALTARPYERNTPPQTPFPERRTGDAGKDAEG